MPASSAAASPVRRPTGARAVASQDPARRAHRRQMIDECEFEAGALGVELVDDGVTDVVITLALELGPDFMQVMLVADEIDRDVVVVPQLLLVTASAVGRTADDVAQG